MCHLARISMFLLSCRKFWDIQLFISMIHSTSDPLSCAEHFSFFHLIVIVILPEPLLLRFTLNTPVRLYPRCGREQVLAKELEKLEPF